MDEGAKRWLLKTAKQNHWRVAAWYDLDDLIQDGFLHYARVRNKYRSAKDPAHIMALFKRCYLNHLNDLSTRKQRTLAYSMRTDELMAGAFYLPPDVTVSTAPPPIRQLLEALGTDAGIAHLRRPYRRRHGHRETLNERLCRLAGLSDPIELSTMLREYLTR